MDNNRNYGENDTQILGNFRKICKSHIELFRHTKNHIRKLLGSSYNYQSGIFRESLLKTFLLQILPKSLAVDTGFVYGFEQLPNSKQIDILIWDESKYSPIYRTSDFVIIPPESVVAVIEVKSNLGTNDIKTGLENLLSVVRLDVEFREKWIDENKNPILPPIGKFLISYKGNNKVEDVLQKISSFYIKEFNDNEYLCEEIVPTLQKIDPIHPEQKDWDRIDRFFPKMIASIENNNCGFYRGLGPPEDIYGKGNFGKLELKRIPYFYSQKFKITIPFEKFIGQLLYTVYKNIGTKGWSTMYAWADFNPIEGFRVGDADELEESSSVPLLDYNNIAFNNE
jgi:Domain of unknown function (DUF6602)